MAHLTQSDTSMRTLFLDIETAPNIVHCWGLWQQNIALNQILASGYVLCWAAKWLGEDEVMFQSKHAVRSPRMLKEVHKLLSEADCVVHYNGTKFDVPTLNKEFLTHGLGRPAPFGQMDLLRTARKHFRFPSNKLDYISQALGFEGKATHRGHQLWVDCMDGKDDAWAEMEAYNRQDVVILEQVYNKLLPWITDHPHVGLHEGKPESCPNCGSEHLNARGFAYTKLGRYQRYRCVDCGSWTRGSKRVSNVTTRSII